MHSCRSFFYL